MLNIIFKYIVIILALLIAGVLIQGLNIVGERDLYNALIFSDWNSLLLFANWSNILMLGILFSITEYIILPILRFITFPINFFTFGLFYFLLSIFAIKAIEYIVPDRLQISGFWSIVFFSLILSMFVSFAKRD
ncbi:MAG: phage holin family protein [Candidatus Pacebacteria bacterium]|nr:phage holin family protein [Candidatus Paceibacterota bacterium]